MNASINLRSWRLLLVLGILAILVRVAGAANPNVTFNLADFTSVSVKNKQVDIYPLSAPLTNGGTVILADKKTYKTSNSGSFVVTNMVPGCYEARANGSWTMTPFSICFTNESGSLNAADYVTITPTVVAANQKFVQQNHGVLVSPTNFFAANFFPGLNVTFGTNSLGQLTINAATNGVSIGNAVIHNGSGILVSPTNFFHGNIFKGTNMVFVTNALGQITISSTGGGSGTSAYTESIDIWLSTRSDGDGDGSMGNPRRADTAAAFDTVMRSYAAQSNITIRLHPGRYYTQGFCPDAPSNGRWQMGLNWRVIGAGIDQSIVILTNTIGGSISARRFYHVIGSDINVDSSYSEVSDLTVDCNLDNLTVVGTTNVFKTIAAVKLNGSHTAIRRVKAIHYGVDGNDITTGGLNDDVFVLSAASTFPQYAPRASHTVIEDCIMLYPSPLTRSNIVEFIHTSGAMNVANGQVAFATNIIIRNNYIDGRFEDGTVKTRAFNSKLWHGLTMGSCELGIVEGNHVQNVDIAGSYQDSFRTRSIICRGNTFLDVDGGGYWNFVAATGEPTAGLDIASLTSSGTNATLTVNQALHDLLPGIDIVHVDGASDAAYNGDFLVKTATATTMTFDLLSTPGSGTATDATAGSLVWSVHRAVREIHYTGNTTLLRHGTNTTYAVAAVGPFNSSILPMFGTVTIANNYFGWSDGKETNNPNTGSVGIYVRNAGHAIIKDNVIALYTNTPLVVDRQNIIAKNNGNVIAYNNRGPDGFSIPARDTAASKFIDALAALEFRIRETNGGPEYLQITAGVMASNVFWVTPTTNGAAGNVLTTDGGHPARLFWGNGSAGLAVSGGIGTNLTLWASGATGVTNLTLRAINGQLGDLMVAMTPGGQPAFAIGTNGNLRVATGSATVASISRQDDYGDGIALDVDIIRFLSNTNEVANIGNTTGIAHLGNNAAFTLGSAGDANLRRLAPGAFNISASNSTTGDGLLQLAKLNFVESQGENSHYVQFLTTNMAATIINYWPRTNPLSGQFLTSIPLSGSTNQWYWASPPAGGTSVLSGAFIGENNGVGTNTVLYKNTWLATNSSLVFSNITSALDFQNGRFLNGLGIWTNTAATNTPLVVNALASSSSNLFTLRLAGVDKFMVNPAGKLLTVDGNAATPALARITDPGDGMYLAEGTFGFSVNGASYASLQAAGASAGLTHTNTAASLIFGSDAWLKRTETGGYRLSSDGTLTDGVLNTARVRFFESQGETANWIELLATNMTANIAMFLPQTNPPAGPTYFLTSRNIAGITNQLYWTNGILRITESGGQDVLGVTRINVSANTLTDNGSGDVTLITSGITIRDVAGTNSRVVTTFTVPNGSLATNGLPAGEATLTFPGGGSGIPLLNGTGTETTFTADAAADTPLKVQGIASQSGALQSWLNNSATVLAQVNASGTFVVPIGSAAAPSIARLGGVGDGIALLDNITRFGFDGVAAVDITPGGIGAIGITNTGVMAHQGPVTYTVQNVTSTSGSPHGRIDGALGNVFKLTLTMSTNLVLTNMLPGPTTVIITNPSTFTVTWNLLTNQWLGAPVNFQPAQAEGNVTYWTFFKEGVQTNGSAVSRGVPVGKIETITFSATPVLDFSKNPDQLFTMTGNVTSWSTAGKVAGVRTISLTIDANGSARTFGTWPATWRWQTLMPTGIGATNQGILNLRSRTASDAEVMAAWNPQL